MIERELKQMHRNIRVKLNVHDTIDTAGMEDGVETSAANSDDPLNKENFTRPHSFERMSFSIRCKCSVAVVSTRMTHHLI